MKSIIYTNILAILILSIISGCKNQPTENGTPILSWMQLTKSTVPDPDLIDENIHSIYISGRGEVWFGTDSGVCSFFSGEWTSLPKDTFNYKISISGGGTIIKREVTAITESHHSHGESSVWFGLNGGGVVRFSLNSSFRTWFRFSFGGGTADNIRGLATLPEGDVFVATTDGAKYYDFTTNPDPLYDGFWRVLPDLPSGVINNVVANKQNEWIYFGMTDGMIKFYERGIASATSHQLAQGYRSTIRSMAVNYSTNTLWLGKDLGVTSYTPGENAEYHYTTGNTNGKLPEGIINAVMTDFFGSTVWFGTNVGLIQFNGTEWKKFSKATVPELPSDTIQALYFDYIKKNLWIGTNKGIAVYNQSGIRNL